MAQLAIKGHATRGREVIELLEMLGGKNKISSDGLKWFNGTNVDSYYTIEEDNHIHIRLDSRKGDYIKFTLEEFLEKYPYKVGDKVINRIDGCVGIVDEMIWDGFSVKYDVTFGYGIDYGCYLVQSLQPYKEETMEGKLTSKEETSLKIDTSQMEKRQIVFSADAPDETELVLGDNFEIKVENGKAYVVRKKLQYPKTFIEVLNFWHPDRQPEDDYQRCYKKDLIEKFQDLLYAKDAYWKIAGEEMGLGKPWEPDWTSSDLKYVIKTMGNAICNTTECSINCILAFPTAEMRDAFYDNFEELIEECKELYRR